LWSHSGCQNIAQSGCRQTATASQWLGAHRFVILSGNVSRVVPTAAAAMSASRRFTVTTTRPFSHPPHPKSFSLTRNENSLIQNGSSLSNDTLILLVDGERVRSMAADCVLQPRFVIVVSDEVHSDCEFCFDDVAADQSSVLVFLDLAVYSTSDLFC